MFNQLITAVRNQMLWTNEDGNAHDDDDDDLISSIKSEVQAELDLNSSMHANSISDDIFFGDGFQRGDIFTLRFNPLEDMRPLRSISTYGRQVVEIMETIDNCTPITYIVLGIDNRIPHRKGIAETVEQALHFIPIGIADDKSVAAFINLDEMTLCQYESGLPMKKIAAIEIIGKMYECGIPDRNAFF